MSNLAGVSVEQYTVPPLSETPREGLTPHTNLILDFFLANPSVVMGFHGVKTLQGLLGLEDSRLAWGATYLLFKVGLLSRLPGHRMVVAHPRTAAQLRVLTPDGRRDLLRSTELVPGWHDLRRSEVARESKG